MSSVNVRLDQALHGYADGHTLLGCSTSLPSRDLKRMLVLSDASGQGGILEEHGYLTGYPLVESKLYALARTWPAHEMHRPGCVWTHTLLISFEDLARISSVNQLLDAFERPKGKNGQSLKPHSVELRASGAPTFSPPPQPEALRRILWALYASPDQKVVSRVERSLDAEVLALSIWEQQWPRLRRSFLFCTGSAKDRSSEAGVFDLQFMDPQSFTSHQRFEDTVSADGAVPLGVGWVEEAIQDVIGSSSRELRSFLREAGGDVSGGRSAFAPLCEIFRLVSNSEPTPILIEEAIAVIGTSLPPGEAKAARRLVATAASNHTSQLTNSSIEFILEQLHLLGSASWRPTLLRFGRELWNRDPNQLYTTLSIEGRSRDMVELVFEELSTSELVSGLRKCEWLASWVVGFRPKVLEDQRVWEHSIMPFDVAIQNVDQSRRKAVLKAMIASGRQELAEKATIELGAGLVLGVVLGMIDSNRGKVSRGTYSKWIRVAAANFHALEGALVSGAARSIYSLACVARATSPDDVRVAQGSRDPWVSAVSDCASSEVREHDDIYLRSFLVARAMTSVSNNPADLLALGFDRVYRAAASSQLPAESWSVLDQNLPARKWFPWDRCERLRIGVVDTFCKRDLNPIEFVKVTNDFRLFRELVQFAANGRRGKKFLQKVEKALRDTADPELTLHAEVIRNVM